MLKRVFLAILLCSLCACRPAFAYDEADAYSYLQQANAALSRICYQESYWSLVMMQNAYDEYAINYYTPMAEHFVDCVESFGPCESGTWRPYAYDALEEAADVLLEIGEEVWWYGQDWEEGDPEYPETIDGLLEIKNEMGRCYCEAWEEYFEQDWNACVRFCQDCMAWEDGDHEVIEWEWCYYYEHADEVWVSFFDVQYELNQADTELQNCEEYDEDDPGTVPNWPEDFEL